MCNSVQFCLAYGDPQLPTFFEIFKICCFWWSTQKKIIRFEFQQNESAVILILWLPLIKTKTRSKTPHIALYIAISNVYNLLKISFQNFIENNMTSPDFQVDGSTFLYIFCFCSHLLCSFVYFIFLWAMVNTRLYIFWLMISFYWHSRIKRLTALADQIKNQTKQIHYIHKRNTFAFEQNTYFI